MKTQQYFAQVLLLTAVLVSFTACYGPKKAQLREVIGITKEDQQAEQQQYDQTEQKKEQALIDERIDTTISNRISKKLNQYKKEIDAVNSHIAMLEGKLSDARAFRRGYRDSIKPMLALLEKHNTEKQLRLERFNMLKNALDISKQNPFDLAAFFGTGKYLIPKENYQQAATLFKPAIDSLILFSNKYAEVPRTATIVVNGYADAQVIDANSELGRIMLQHDHKTTATKEELNSTLSALRAEEISELLEKLLQQKKEAFTTTDKLKFNFYGYGQGETYPSKKISNYTKDDERRRIVLIYWSVIPD